MKRRWAIRYLRWFLLLCVVLNLGDAPYVDEILADAGNQAATTSASTDHEQAPSQNDDASINASAYENLLANIPIPARSMVSAVSALPGDVAPAFDGYRIPDPPVSRLERPPRNAALRLA